MTLEVGDLYLDYSKHRLTAETIDLLVALARRAGVEQLARRHVRGREDQRHRAAGGAARRPAGPGGRVDRRRRRRRRARGARGARPHGRPSPTRSGRARGRATPASGSATSSTSASAAATSGPAMAYEALRDFSRSRPDVPVRVQHRRHRLLGGGARPRSGRDAVHHRVEDVHDARDDDQRPRRARDWSLAALGDEAAVAKHFVAVSTNAEEVADVRHRHRQHVRVLGLGRRPLLATTRPSGLSLMVVDRRRPVRRDAGRLPRHGRPLPHRADRVEPADADGPDRHLVRQLLRRRDAGGAALQPVPGAACRPTCSSSTWRATASRSTREGEPVDVADRARSCGASPAPTASTRTTS